MRIICSNGLVCDSNDYLSHHGILGQKWGKQNGPPYPLSSSAHSSSEKKAGWRKSLDNDGQTLSKRQLKKNIKAKKEDVDYAQRSLNQAEAQLKGDRLFVSMTKKKLKKLEAKGKTDKSYEEARKKIYDDYWDKQIRMDDEGGSGRAIDNRINELAKKNPRIDKIIKEHTGDGGELVEAVKKAANDKKLNELIDRADEESFAIEKELNERLRTLPPMNKKIAEERQLLEDFKKYVQNSEINVKKAEALKAAAIMDLTEAQLKLDVAKAKKVIDGYTREQIDAEKKRLGADVYGSKANKYVDKYPDVRKAKIEFDMRSDQVAKELQKKYPPNSEKSRRAGMDDPDTFWNKMKKDKELQRLEKEYHDSLRKHNVSDRQAVKSLKLASRASSMRSSGMSYAEIAKKLGIPESSVGYYLNM